MNNVRVQRGFTLVEILIVVAIMGILAAIALPSYLSSVQKARRADAKIAMEKAAASQERWFFQRGGYSSDLDNIGGTGGVLISPEGYYTLSLNNFNDEESCVGGDGVQKYNCYTIIAQPAAGSPQLDDDKCQLFTLSHTGQKTAKNSAAADTSDECW